TITYRPADYRLTWDGTKYNYSSIDRTRSSTACVTLVPAEDNYIANGRVAGQNFSCDSGGGARFVSSSILGNTTATVGLLKNDTYFQQTKSSGYDDSVSVYAKPGDTVQFFYALCFGAHNVGARSSGYYTRTDNANNAVKNFFTVYNGTKYDKEGNNSFLFGRLDYLLGKEIVVSNNAARAKNLKKTSAFYVNNTRNKIFYNSKLFSDYVYVKGQELRFASPDTGTKDYDSIARGAYDCFWYSGITNFSSSQASSGYQIPGFQTPPAGQCTSAGLALGTYGQGKAMNSVVGATINQSLNYTYLAVWRRYLSKITGSCGCDNDSKNYAQKIFSSVLDTMEFIHRDNDAYYESDVRTADRLFNKIYTAYYNEGYTTLGRYKAPTYAGSSTKRYFDGDYSVDLCKKASKKCRFCWGSGKNRTCTDYIYTKYNNNNATSREKPDNVFTKEPVTKTASVIIPYNFDTTLSANITNSSDILYAGERVTTDFNIDITPMANPVTSEKDPDGNYIPYATITPDATQVQVAEFLVRDVNSATGADINVETIASKLQDNYGYTGKDLCTYFYNIGRDVIAECKDEAVKGAELENCDIEYCEGSNVGNNQSNPDGEQGYYTAGKTQYGSSQFTKLVPDVKAGYKYCTVVGINYGNSHGGNGTSPFKTLSANSRDANFGANSRSVNSVLNTRVDEGYYWHISSASCRTIAKKPSFQVWNGGIFSSGNIKTSITRKYANAILGDLPQYDASLAAELQKKQYLFGSWEQYYVVAKGTVSGFASASALGYGSGMSTTGFGTSTRGFTNCDFFRLTIANETCGTTYTAGRYTGEPDGESFKTDDSRVANLVSQMLARYTKTSLSRTPKPSTVNAADDSVYENLSDSLSNSSRYLYIDGDFAINNTIVQASGTRVIHVNGHLSINRNICLGSTGICQQGDTDAYKNGYDQNANNLSLLGRNTADTYNDISQIPQVIIIADSIGIGSEVNQIDAWLITADVDDSLFYDGGYVNTCDTFADGVTGSGECWKTLKINGPVVTRALLTNRTGGAWAGLSGDIGNPAYDYLGTVESSYYQGGTASAAGDAASRDLSCDGSITPAEIFDLHPLVYLWSYYQAQRFTQAITTYTQEYAPRF
ncbi:hypothetical protein IJ103_00435, partial [Candidatus Saccharibacteria bacterium]|nr:hypothetical protein [Candidatus Saccharibacteria bacterium]